MKKTMRLDTHYRYGKAGSRRRGWITALGVVLLLLFCTCFIFSIKEIRVEGNVSLTDEEICREVGVSEGKNMFQFLLSGLISDRELNPMLASVDVYVKWPNRVRICVNERTIVCYVSYMGTYLCIDEGGYVVDSTHVLKEDLPIVTGMTIDQVTMGEPLTTRSAYVAQTVMSLCNYLHKYGLSSSIVRMDMMDTDDIRLYTPHLEIRFGADEDLELKVQAYRRILDEDPGIEGILHLEDLEGQVYLEHVL